MNFTDYFEYDDLNSSNEIIADSHRTGENFVGFFKMTFKWKKPTKLEYILDVDFLIDDVTIYISVLYKRNKKVREFSHYYIPNDIKREKIKEAVKMIANMDPFSAYYSVLEDEFFDNIVQEIGGVDFLFRGIIAKSFS